MMVLEYKFKAVDAVLKLIELKQLRFDTDKDTAPQQVARQFLDTVELIINRLDTNTQTNAENKGK